MLLVRRRRTWKQWLLRRPAPTPAGGLSERLPAFTEMVDTPGPSREGLRLVVDDPTSPTIGADAARSGDVAVGPAERDA
jgi:hypothetical protein